MRVTTTLLSVQTNDDGNLPLFLVAAGYIARGKTYSLLLANFKDPPVLKVLLRQAVHSEPVKPVALHVTIPTLLGKQTLTQNMTLRDTELPSFLEHGQSPCVGDDNGVNPKSSQRHVVVEVRAAGHHLLSLLDLCGNETSDIRVGPLKRGSGSIAGDLVKLRLEVEVQVYSAPYRH